MMTKVWVLEKLWLGPDGGLTDSNCWTFRYEGHAHSAMIDDWHEEYIDRKIQSPPDENVGPFENDTEADLVLPDNKGRIKWKLYESDLEE